MEQNKLAARLIIKLNEEPDMRLYYFIEVIVA